MKKLGILIGVFGLFALVGVASAATADQLQPAQTITYNEELVVNATGRFDSIYIGSTEAGVGGVTFFNGTIVNNSVDENGESTIPVTFGDDVRIDGEIYRTEVGGDNPLKLADTVRPQTDNTYDLGTESNGFRNVYAANLLGGSATITSTLTVGSSASITDELTVADYIAVGGGYGDTGSTLDASGNGQFNGTLTVDGDIDQALTMSGAVKAMVEIDGDAADCLEKSWTVNDTAITCVRSGAGDYTVTFDSTYDVDTRYYSATVMDDARMVRAEATDNVVSVYSYDDGGLAANANIMFVVY